MPITAKDVGADVQGDPQAALSAARSLVDQGASCLIGPAITPESIAIANGLTIRKRVTIWPVGTSMRLRTIKDEGTIFRTVPPDSLQALALAAAIADKLGSADGKLVSVVYRNEPYGELLSKGFAKAWEAKGGKVQGPVVFDPAQATFDSEAGQVVANNPDAYVIIDYPDTYAKLGAALVRTGKFDPDQGLRRRRARLLDRAQQHPAPGHRGHARHARRHADRHRQPTSCSIPSGRRPAGSSITRSTPTASIPRRSASSPPRPASRRIRPPSPPISGM